MLRTLLQELRSVFQRTGLPGTCHIPIPEAFQDAETVPPSTAPAPAERLERLRPIFERLPRADSPPELLKHPPRTATHYPLQPLSFHPDAALPRREDAMTGYLREDYRRVWQAFLGEMQALRRLKEFHTYFFTVFFLMKKYFSRVPSTEQSDISVFDAARIAAAVADCRFRHDAVRRSGPAPAFDDGGRGDDDHSMLLIGATVCGIRHFSERMEQAGHVRTIAGLRGCSLYLSLLTETVRDYLSAHLALTVAHHIWRVGGNFLLLAPNTAEITYHLKACMQEVHTFMLRRFRGELAVVTAQAEVSPRGVWDNFGPIYDELQARLERECRRPLCENLPTSEVWQIPPDDHEAAQAADYERLGARIPRLNQPDGRLVKKIKRGDEAWKEPPLVEYAIGRALHIGWDMNPTEYAQTDAIYLVNNLDDAFWGGSSTKYGFKLLAVHADTYTAVEADRANGTPAAARPGDIKRFGDMAADGRTAGALGALRMDVDRLGSIVAAGLPPARRNLVSMAALSEAIDIFCSGYVHHLCRSEFPKNTAIVQAGGDGVSIVGAWDALPDLACRIRQAFRAYTCHQLSLSGGLAVCARTCPPHRAVAQARQQLVRQAKRNAARVAALNGTTTSGDALAIFQRRFTWDDFFTVRAIGNRLADAVAEGRLPRHSIRALLRLHRAWQRERRLNTARLFYLTARAVRDRACRDILAAQQQQLDHACYIPALVDYVFLKTRHIA